MLTDVLRTQYQQLRAEFSQAEKEFQTFDGLLLVHRGPNERSPEAEIFAKQNDYQIVKPTLIDWNAGRLMVELSKWSSVRPALSRNIVYLLLLKVSPRTPKSDPLAWSSERLRPWTEFKRLSERADEILANCVEQGYSPAWLSDARSWLRTLFEFANFSAKNCRPTHPIQMAWRIRVAWEDGRLYPHGEDRYQQILSGHAPLHLQCNYRLEDAQIQKWVNRCPDHYGIHVRNPFDCSVRLLDDIYGYLEGAAVSQGATDSTSPSVQIPTHSLDFRSVNWFGEPHEFTANQAACIKLLWLDWKKGSPAIGQHTILENADISQSELRVVFRDHPAWGTMIQQGKTKGSFRLVEPD